MNPDVISIEKHINLRETEALVFNEQQFNVGFEFVKYIDNDFELLEIPPNIAKLEVVMDTEIYNDDGTTEILTRDVDLIDCELLYPDLVSESVFVAGPDSRMYCLDNQVAQIQGMGYFNTHTEIRISIEHCGDDDTLACDENINADEFFVNAGLAIHDINNNIDLTDYSLGGKPTQNFDLLRLVNFYG